MNILNSLIETDRLKRGRRNRIALLAALALLCAAAAQPSCADAVTASYLYKLSDFSGTIPFDAVRMYADRQYHEIYVTGTDNTVHIFNDKGMEVYQFNEDGGSGRRLGRRG